MSQTEIERTVSANDVDEMMRLYREEPWGVWRDNLHFAHLSALLANINRGKGTPAFDAKDFMLMPETEKKASDKGAVVEWFRSVATGSKKRKKRKKAK